MCIRDRDYYQTVGGGNSGICSMYTYDATNIRLAELSLGYNIPVNKWVSWIKGAHVSVVGRNLIMFYNKAPVSYTHLDVYKRQDICSIAFLIKIQPVTSLEFRFCHVGIGSTFRFQLPFYAAGIFSGYGVRPTFYGV